jgi:hypothetical protein
MGTWWLDHEAMARAGIVCSGQPCVLAVLRTCNAGSEAVAAEEIRTDAAFNMFRKQNARFG